MIGYHPGNILLRTASQVLFLIVVFRNDFNLTASALGVRASLKIFETDTEAVSKSSGMRILAKISDKKYKQQQIGLLLFPVRITH